MLARILFLSLCAILLTSCSEYFQEDSQPKMKQEAHTSPTTGQSTYSYHPVDEPASR
jgi:hypothetical protein